MSCDCPIGLMKWTWSSVSLKPYPLVNWRSCLFGDKLSNKSSRSCKISQFAQLRSNYARSYISLNSIVTMRDLAYDSIVTTSERNTHLHLVYKNPQLLLELSRRFHLFCDLLCLQHTWAVISIGPKCRSTFLSFPLLIAPHVQRLVRSSHLAHFLLDQHQHNVCHD